MTCDRCEEFKQQGARYCPICGEHLSRDCSRCEEYRRQGAMFCPVCGNQISDSYHPYRAPRKHPLGFILVAGLVAAVQGLLIMLVEVFTGWVKYGYMSDAIEGKQYPIYIVTPHLQDLFNINDTWMRIVYILEIITVTFCLGLMLYQAYRRFTGSDNDPNVLKDTATYEVPVLTGLMIFFETFIMVFMRLMGFDFGSTSIDDTGAEMFALLHASVYEELLCRLLMLGLPSLVVALVLKRKDSPKWKYLLGGAKYEHWMLIFVVFSSTMFGLAHLDNWDTWKFFPTFAFGILAGYLFLKYGIFATISMHFINDFLLAGQWLSGSQAMLVLGILAVGFCALPCIVDYVRKIRRFVSEIRPVKEAN